MILFLLILVSFALYVMTPEERTRVARTLMDVVQQVKRAATKGSPKGEPFGDALRARTRWPLVTPALAAANVTIFAFMLFGDGALGDPATLVSWGGNFGPRTTNGEWGRLLTTVFVHSGMLHLVVNVVALVQLGVVLERLVGHVTFTAVYVAAGVFTSLASLSIDPVAVSVGASGAIFGIYGLLLASSIWGFLYRSTVTIPLKTVMRLGPSAAVFILYNVVTDSVRMDAELIGLVTGFASGLVLTNGVSDGKPSVRRVAVAIAAAVAITVAAAVPLRGVANVKPEIARVIAIEDRTATAYQTAIDRFRNGRITAEALAQLIDRTIMPELREARARLKALDRIPQEHQSLVARAEEYLRLRDESWRLRAEALQKANMVTLRKADRMERASLEVLEEIRTADQD